MFTEISTGFSRANSESNCRKSSEPIEDGIRGKLPERNPANLEEIQRRFNKGDPQFISGVFLKKTLENIEKETLSFLN